MGKQTRRQTRTRCVNETGNKIELHPLDPQALMTGGRVIFGFQFERGEFQLLYGQRGSALTVQEISKLPAIRDLLLSDLPDIPACSAFIDLKNVFVKALYEESILSIRKSSLTKDEAKPIAQELTAISANTTKALKRLYRKATTFVHVDKSGGNGTEFFFERLKAANEFFGADGNEGSRQEYVLTMVHNLRSYTMATKARTVTENRCDHIGEQEYLRSIHDRWMEVLEAKMDSNNNLHALLSARGKQESNSPSAKKQQTALSKHRMIEASNLQKCPGYLTKTVVDVKKSSVNLLLTICNFTFVDARSTFSSIVVSAFQAGDTNTPLYSQSFSGETLDDLFEKSLESTIASRLGNNKGLQSKTDLKSDALEQKPFTIRVDAFRLPEAALWDLRWYAVLKPRGGTGLETKTSMSRPARVDLGDPKTKKAFSSIPALKVECTNAAGALSAILRKLVAHQPEKMKEVEHYAQQLQRCLQKADKVHHRMEEVRGVAGTTAACKELDLLHRIIGEGKVNLLQLESILQKRLSREVLQMFRKSLEDEIIYKGEMEDWISRWKPVDEQLDIQTQINMVYQILVDKKPKDSSPYTRAVFKAAAVRTDLFSSKQVKVLLQMADGSVANSSLSTASIPSLTSDETTLSSQDGEDDLDALVTTFLEWRKSQDAMSIGNSEEAGMDDHFLESMQLNGIKQIKKKAFKDAVLEISLRQSSREHLTDLWLDSVTCPLTLEVFVEPVVLSDGYTYERTAITEWIAKKTKEGGPIPSPVTNLPLLDLTLHPNTVLRNMARGLRP